jgi:hypothetical protein
MKEYFLLLLAVVLLAAACTTSKTPQPEERVTHKEAPINQNKSAVDTTNWKTYRNEDIEISFQFPGDWPYPVLDKRDFSVGGSYVPGAAIWRLFIGPLVKGFCEGETCYIYYFDGWFPQNPEKIVADLKSNELIRIEQDSYIAGNRVVVYEEGGICGDRSAFIFLPAHTIRFTARCGQDFPDTKATFDKILSSVTAGPKSE